MPASGHIETATQEYKGGRVATVTIDYQERLNVLNTAIAQDLTETFERLGGDAELRAVVLTGAGDRAFVGGADVNELIDLDARSAEVFITGMHRCYTAVRDCPVPVIARINGHCLGGGLALAAACSMRAASEGAKLGFPEARVGIPPVIETALLPGMVGWGRAHEMLLTGDTIDAATAAQWGLVERVVPADQLDGAVESWVESILACGPRAIRAQKALMRKWDSLPLTAAIAAGIPVFAEAFGTDEPRSYLNSFRERKR